MKRDKADDAFSKYIRLRDKACVRCKSPVLLSSSGAPISHHASHFKGRAKENTRYDPQNVDTLCHGCHVYFTSQPDEHYRFQVEKKGQVIVDEIILKSSFYKKKDRALEYLYWKKKLKEDFNLSV